MDRRRWKKAALLGGIVALLGALVPMQLALGQAPGIPDPLAPEEGILHLHLGAADHLTYDPEAGTEVVQSVSTKNKCTVSLETGTDELGSISWTGGIAAGIVKDGLGVRAGSPDTGTSCGRVDAAETLTFKLAGQLEDLAIDYAELDMEGKFDVTIVAAFRLDGDPVGTPLVLDDDAFSDSGPDSGNGDNERWELAPGVLFDEVTFSASGGLGSFSLEGGADGTPSGPLGTMLGTGDSLFRIVSPFEGQLECPSIGEGYTATTSTDEGTGPSVADVARNENLVGACVAKPYNLDSSEDQGVDVINFEQGNVPDQETAQFVMRITWEPLLPGTPSHVYPTTIAGRTTTIQYTETDPVHAIEWCAAVQYDLDGNVVTATLPDPEEFWCLVDQDAALLADGNVAVTEILYGLGDPKIFR